MCDQITGGQVSLGPVQETVEARAVIGHQCEEHSISLPFRCGTVTRVMIDNADLTVHEASSVALPKRWPILRRAASRRHQHHDNTSPLHVQLHCSFQTVTLSRTLAM